MFVRDLPRSADGQFRSGSASGLPLPTALAGISVAIVQASGTLKAPIFAVRQENECQAAGMDEDAAQVPNVITLRKVVENLVADWPASRNEVT